MYVGSKLKVTSLDGVTLLVETLGGQWGPTELEERHEHFEKAIYATTQRHDESNDSFISRMEGFFTELIARKTTIGGNPNVCRPETVHPATGGQEEDSLGAMRQAHLSASCDVLEIDGQQILP